MEILPAYKTITREEQNRLDRLKDDDGNSISETCKKHWRTFRIKCRKCNQDFCKNCWETPYHLGDTCESLRAKKSQPKCRFCGKLLTSQNRLANPISRALNDVCNERECVDKVKISSTKMLSCGHYSLGIRDEPQQAPCLFKGCKARDPDIEATVDDDCCICYTDKLGQGPIIALKCNHVFHYACLKRILEGKWKTPFISFEFKQCPLCKQDMKSPNLKDLLDPLDKLQMDLKERALKRLKYEQRLNDKALQKGGDWYGNEVGYAEHTYAFFMCYECKKPYFGGAKECKAQDDDSNNVDPKDLICNECQHIDSVDECKKHGPEYLAYKCRYCCTMGVFHCWGKVHFCRSCHQPGVWDKLSTYSTGKNKKNIIDYPQCESVKAELKKLMKNPLWSKWNEAKRDEEMKKIRANPDTCPLGARHPPNGFEFGLGCTLCADAKTKLENEKARLKVEQENKARLAKLMGPFMNLVKSGKKFVHKHPMDENGILYFFGTFGKRKAYQNPAKLGMVIVNTSEMMPDSAQCGAFIGRQCVRCVTKPSASCWFSIDFVDKFIKPSHYTLRHYISWDTECLRNWVIEGSIDGEHWLVLRQHQNDQALNYKGQAYTWALHDYGCAFRKLRVKQTGPNNNNHYFLACSGFETYGTLYKDDTADIEYNFNKAYQEQQKMKQLSLVRFWQMIETGQAGVYHFTFNEDFDDNGILYFLGTKGGQQSWKNPSISDEVSVCSSALVKDSVEISNFVGREPLRLVTKPEDNAWMQVDFKDKLIQPSYYSLKHYISWDTECLRNWILQASNDGIRWVTVKKHEEDTSLNEKGATHTWPVQSRGAYRIWRIKQTGLNSNKHKYLACSGIEFYGQLFLTKFDALSGLKPQHRQQAERLLNQLKFVKKCKFKENNDKNGCVYWIGTRGNTSNWVNPGARKWIKCDASSIMRDSQPVFALCGRISVRLVTQPLENSWMSIDFKNLYISPTHYSLRHYISWDTEALRNWLLEASFDGNTWHTLRQHKNDSSLNHKGATWTWEIKAKGAKYRAFRIRQIGVNSNKHYYLSCSGFEIYGDIYQIAYANPKKAISQSGQPGGEQNSEPFDASLTGQVPWDKDEISNNNNNNNNNGISKKKSSNQLMNNNGASAGVVQEESQDMALLREMARQEKQRLIHHLSAGNPYPFYYTKDFGENGILYFLGTDWRTAPWRNPAEAGVVTVTSSRLAKDSYPATAICGNKVVRCVCMAEKNNWFMIDFRNIYIKPTHYCLRHYDSWDTECLRNWYLEGTNDLKKFKILREHKKDKSLYGKGSTHTWQLDTRGKRYRAFRIRQFGHNSNKHWYLACSGIEFYGEIYFRQK